MLISVLPKVSFAQEEKAKSETVSKKEFAKTEKDSEKVQMISGNMNSRIYQNMKKVN